MTALLLLRPPEKVLPRKKDTENIERDNIGRLSKAIQRSHNDQRTHAPDVLYQCKHELHVFSRISSQRTELSSRVGGRVLCSLHDI
jgi:hypothetical protein